MYGRVDTSEAVSIKTIYTAYSKRLERNHYFDGEQHDFWEMVIVLEGKIGVTAGSDVFVLHEGTAVIHEPMEFHRLWSEGEVYPKILIFSFSASGMPKCCSKFFEIPQITRPLEILAQIRECYETSGINVTGIKDDIFPREQIALKELEIFILEVLSNQPRASGVKKSQTVENYAKIIEVMEKNLDKSLMVSDIADMCHMSEINLKKTFSRYSGMGVMAYFNKMKIDGAREMIENGASVRETAESFGFSNQNYFSTVFKRITGNPPAYYK